MVLNSLSTMRSMRYYLRLSTSPLLWSSPASIYDMTFSGAIPPMAISSLTRSSCENFSDLETIGTNSKPDRPVVISETGADGDHVAGPETGLFSLDYQAEVYRRQIEILRNLNYIKGMSPWILYDFRVERRQGVYQRGFNRKGLIAADKKTKKPAFDVLAAYYAERAAMGRRSVS